MLTLTKVFHFEMAHAIHGYSGACRHIHGHSYELHVTVSASKPMDGYLQPPGFLINFKEIKKLVTETVIQRFDHRLVLSTEFLLANPSLSCLENLVIFEAEPTAENIIIYFRNTLVKTIPDNMRLVHLKLFETADSFAEWEDNCDVNYRSSSKK